MKIPESPTVNTNKWNLKIENANTLETSTREESQYARSLIEASLDPLVTISGTGKIMDMNAALASVTGMSREELTGTVSLTTLPNHKGRGKYIRRYLPKVRLPILH